MKRYLVNYNNFRAGNEYADTVKEAKEIAVRGMAYTHADVSIEDTKTGRTVSVSEWCPNGWFPGLENDVLVSFGDYGFYANWMDFDYSVFSEEVG